MYHREVKKMWIRQATIGAALMFCSPALAEGDLPHATTAAPKGRVARRQAEKLDQQRSEALRSKRKVHEIGTVYVFARPQRPLASVETAAQQFRFPVGTARYSERDRRFLKSARGERW
jgi:hypothetical protein